MKPELQKVKPELRVNRADKNGKELELTSYNSQ